MGLLRAFAAAFIWQLPRTRSRPDCELVCCHELLHIRSRPNIVILIFPGVNKNSNLYSDEYYYLRAGRGDRALLILIFLNYDLLIERLARQWVAYSERHNPKSRRTRRADT
jgi:hypothetical protein